MAQPSIWWTAATILGMAAVAVAVRRSGLARRRVGSGWRDPDAPRRIREIAAPIERLANWPGLGDYLAAVAWTESRGNPRACHGDCKPNSARGWFQIRPKSGRTEYLGLSSNALLDENTSVALAAWYAHRLRPRASEGQEIDWLAIRRGWALPGLVRDVNEQNDRSPKVRARLEEGLKKSGMHESFMYQPAFPPGYYWPGIDAVLAAVGRSRL